MCYLFYMFLNTWSGRTGIPSMETSFWNPPSIESGALETCCFLLWPWFSQKRKKKLDCHHLGIWVNPSLEDNPKLRQIQLHSVLLSLTGGFSNRVAGLKSCQIWPFFVVCVCVCVYVCVCRWVAEPNKSLKEKVLLHLPLDGMETFPWEVS